MVVNGIIKAAVVVMGATLLASFSLAARSMIIFGFSPTNVLMPHVRPIGIYTAIITAIVLASFAVLAATAAYFFLNKIIDYSWQCDDTCKKISRAAVKSLLGSLAVVGCSYLIFGAITLANPISPLMDPSGASEVVPCMSVFLSVALVMLFTCSVVRRVCALNRYPTSSLLDISKNESLVAESEVPIGSQVIA